MRRWAILVLLVAIVLPAFAEKPVSTQMVTVAQLEQMLAAAHGVRDGKLAQQIADMKLTERLSDASFARLETNLPGNKSHLALVALADESAFLDLPAAEIPCASAPDASGQAALLAKMMDYLNKAVTRSPDFYATRVTTRFAAHRR